MSDNRTRLESLPNELLLDLIGYVRIHDLYRVFWGLNSRLNDLLRSLNNLSLVVGKNDTSLITLFARQIILLEIENQCNIDLSLFPDLHWLTLEQATEAQVAQIRPELMPNLAYLSLSVESYCDSLSQLADDVFSNGFPSLRRVHLGNFEYAYFPHSWSQSPHLHSVHIFHIQSDIIPIILVSCSNLKYLKVHLSDDDDDFETIPRPTSFDHPLKKFILSANSDIWHYTQIDTLLIYMPNVQWIDFEFWYGRSLIDLTHSLAHQLRYLHRFDCWITVHYDSNRRRDVDTIRKIHPCFNRIEYGPGPDEYLEFSQWNNSIKK